MSTRHLLLPSLLALTACGQSTKQSPSTPADAAKSAPSEPAPAAAEDPGTNLHQVVAIARACAKQRLGNLTGASGTPLVLDQYFLIEPTSDGIWKVTFTEESPSSRPYGRSFEVDAGQALCDGAPLASPATSARMSKAEAVLAAAEKCGRAEPFDGRGVCGSALLFEQPTIHHLNDVSWVVSFPEESPNCIPRGQDLVIAADGSSCSAAPMD